jgi:hypothetical protein
MQAYTCTVKPAYNDPSLNTSLCVLSIFFGPVPIPQAARKKFLLNTISPK